MKDKLYIKLYTSFQKLIEKGEMKPGDKLPSLRAVSEEYNVSKTTAENAYFHLMAAGYIVSREKSGYYVSNAVRNKKESHRKKTEEDLNVKYDFSKIGEDKEVFCFDLWRRYMQSTLRNTTKLISYGDPKGEKELRIEICEYIKKSRNIFCTPDKIIVGASLQSLLMLLCILLKSKGLKSVSVPTADFMRADRVFSDFGYKVFYRQKESDIIYVAPSRMTLWGDIMPLKRRYELMEHSKIGHLVIEDDYQNEFCFEGKSMPSIYGLSGGENVVYMGSFSRVLLPSIRISFMVLPGELTDTYESIGHLYNQTASKSEQLCLCQFLRDNQLNKRIKKIKKLYDIKKQKLLQILKVFQKQWGCELLLGQCGTEIGLRIHSEKENSIIEFLKEKSISCQFIKENKSTSLLIFSCGIIENALLDEMLKEYVI